MMDDDDNAQHLVTKRRHGMASDKAMLIVTHSEVVK